jgi:hypothetical protein
VQATKSPHSLTQITVDCFPLKTREPSERDLLVGDVTPSVTYQRHREIWPRIIESGGSCAEDSAVKDSLQKSKIYKSWQHGMPFLKDVPIMKKFRSGRLSADDLHKANDVILTHGMWLPAGQILYRGGDFASETITITDGPISTTLIPSVAWWHAAEVHGQIAALRIIEPESIRAFVFSSRGHQRLKHEHEVLLQNQIILSRVSKHEVSGLVIFEYDVRAE